MGYRIYYNLRHGEYREEKAINLPAYKVKKIRSILHNGERIYFAILLQESDYYLMTISNHLKSIESIKEKQYWWFRRIENNRLIDWYNSIVMCKEDMRNEYYSSNSERQYLYKKLNNLKPNEVDKKILF